MLNFRNTLITGSVALAALVITDIFITVDLWFYLGIVLALIVLLIWGSIRIQAGFYLPSLCSGKRNNKAVSLTFDDGPDGLITPMILDILREKKVKATFFIVGSKAEKHPEILQRIDREGHIIGGHSLSHHFFFDLFSGKHMKSELMLTADIVFKATGKKIVLFRPPYGVTNPTLGKVLKTMNYRSIGWSLKSKDTVLKDNELLLKRLKSKLQAGDIILFHDNKPWIVNLLKAFITYLDEENYSIERIDDLLNIKVYDAQ
jgi:peptidoglycan/xylan/chitin deacetylase (PgdA/CDA1 family)